MKMNLKTTFAALAMAFCGMANAQQLPNGTFDADWENCYPWEKGAKVKNERGTQPSGWCMANVNGMGGLGATIVGAEGTGRSGSGKSVILTNTPNPLSASQVVPGYFSLGTTWATAKATITGSVTAGTADGGSFGGISFTKRPDAIRFYYKRAHNIENTTKSPTNLTERASIVAYAWKGTWTQKDVPSNTALTPSKVTMTDRSNNILGKDCLTGGAISKTADAELISVVEYYIEGNQVDWKQVTIPFEYKNSTAIPEKLNIIFAANDLFADRSGIGAGNQLSIDDVELVYYHSLSALSYNGKAVAGFAETKYSYSVDEVYDASKLAYTKTGVASTVSTSYNETSAILTITVKGDDDKTTSYTIQFKKPTIVNMTITDAKYATFVTPYAVAVPQGVTYYRCFNVQADRQLILAKQTATTIPANIPVILYSENPVSQTFSGVAQYTSPVKIGLLTGVYSDTQAPKGSYVLQNIDGVTGFYKVVDAIPTVKANRCYITLLTSSSAKMLGFTTEEETAINAINALTSGKIETIYNASGVRQPSLQKGMNIVKMSDGTIQKILVK